MADSKQIKAYIQDASGQLVPLSTDSLVLEFPTGDSLEIVWDAPHPNDPRPLCAQVWAGRRASLSQEEIDALTQTTSLAFHASAANLMLIRPDSYPIRRATSVPVNSE